MATSEKALITQKIEIKKFKKVSNDLSTMAKDANSELEKMKKERQNLQSQVEYLRSELASKDKQVKQRDTNIVRLSNERMSEKKVVNQVSCIYSIDNNRYLFANVVCRFCKTN